MEEFLRVVEEPASTSTEVEIDPEKLKFFASMLKMWDYAKISAHWFQNLSFEDKSKILRNSYTEMSSKYLLTPGKKFLLLFYSAIRAWSILWKFIF